MTNYSKERVHDKEMLLVNWISYCLLILSIWLVNCFFPSGRSPGEQVIRFSWFSHQSNTPKVSWVRTWAKPSFELLIFSSQGFVGYTLIKLRNINPHNTTHSLISRNPRERMFVVQFSLLIVTFLSIISKICHQCKPPKKSTHTLALRHVSKCGVSPSYSYS